jgi:cysteinyl-tRNA synthetase
LTFGPSLANPQAMTDTPLMLFNSLTRSLEPFTPVYPGVPGDLANPPEARVYSCGPTVYNYPHIGNMRAYVFADVLGRTLSFKGCKLTHVINITDVGHLTDDADAGEDKMERMAKSIWDIADHYKQAYWADIRALNIRQPAQWTIATDYVPQMIAFAERIAAKHCYELESGLYFDVSTVADYGRLARAATDEGEGRIEKVDGKRNAADFAIWRKTPPGEKRQMEWDSPWGRGAPGWHLECSVMSGEVLGFPFDIHTGGIDHREIHHPNEIAQNQAICCTNGLDNPANSGAKIWMHNNFLVERSGKMSKSSGEFLRIQLLIDKGYHPLAYRLMCLQAHYRSELEFSWEGLGAALTRLKRLVMALELLKKQADLEDTQASFAEREDILRDVLADFAAPLFDDLTTPLAMVKVEATLIFKPWPAALRLEIVRRMDEVLGLNLLNLTREDLRLRPKSATITEDEIETILTQRKAARAEKDFAQSDALRDALAAQGVEVMDGDPLGWDWKLT